jgi:lysozyme
MKLSAAGFDLIRSFEGYHTALPDGSCKAYLDTLAKPHIWTIGYGVTEGVTADMVLTKEQAEAMFRKELEKHEAIVSRLVRVEIGQSNFDALVSFQYNTGGLPGSTLLKKLNNGDFDGAAKCFDSWNKAGGKVVKGLVRRRAAERAMFEQDAKDPEIPEGSPDMPQRVDEPGKVKASDMALKLAPPTAFSIGMTVFEAWQKVGDAVADKLAWIIAKPMAAGVLAATALAYWLIPKRST